MQANEIEVLAPGTSTTIQDYPGRPGLWAVGVPPSGPMDALSFRLGNRLLGNGEGAAGLEITLRGPTLRFRDTVVVCLTGADLAATVDGVEVRTWAPFRVQSGATLDLRPAVGRAGLRSYLLARGGIDVPAYLGSRSTFTLGGFGGHLGRPLTKGDVLPLGLDRGVRRPPGPRLPASLVPRIGRSWQIGVLYGPHAAPDYFTKGDIDALFAASWEVHPNSARTGVRLVGPKPSWARLDGGEAGLHPSNIHDNAYAVGSVNFTGDMPVILGPDGPSLGGFVCPAVVAKAQLWKLGQLAPRDRVRLVPLSHAATTEAERVQELTVKRALPPKRSAVRPLIPRRLSDPVLARTEVAGGVQVTIRPSGDHHLLVEFGPNVLDLNLRFHVFSLQSRLEADRHPGVIDLTPGIRSLQIHFDPKVVTRDRLHAHLNAALEDLPAVDDIRVPTRIVHLPLSWDDAAVHETIRRYMSGVRPDAPWCPSNIEFIRRMNGLESVESVKDIVFSASYLVMGLGDVYLGAPVATPLDPRHRLVTTKYNPARTWTPANVVGIGGAYLCVYGMEGPGGYQLFGRTLQMWNDRPTDDFEGGKPWLLRFFDQLRFFPVSHDELSSIREDFPRGRYRLRVESDTFDMKAYREFLGSIEGETSTFRERQRTAFDAERTRWRASGELDASAAMPPGAKADAPHGA